MKYVLVAVNLPVKNLFRQFIYRLPETLLQVTEGWRVLVPFGPQKVEGFVVRAFSRQEAVALLAKDKPDYDLNKVKEVLAALGTRPWFTEEMLHTARWLARYYMCSLAEAMRLFIPGKTSILRKAVYRDGKLMAYEIEERLKARTVIAYTITDGGRKALQEGDRRAKTQIKALGLLQDAPEPMDGKQAEELHISSAILRALAEKGWAARTEKRMLRNSYDRKAERKETLQLTGEQEKAVAAVKAALAAAADENNLAAGPQEFLLQGITGSGKTEVYLRAAELALKQGKQVLVLVPEIALTAQIVRRFQAWFRDEVAVAHSKLSQNERGDVWYKIRTGEANILIGVRSAVFAPFKNLGLVIIDEEQENSYKQEERPSYHAREVARCRCRENGAVLLMGSATPSLETYYRAISGTIGHLQLTERPSGAVLPEVKLVDMREELAQKNFSVISRALRREIIAAVHKGEQAVVLLNRRGFSTFVMCRDCGETLVCPHCAVSLVYHADEQVMRCHYCGNTYPVPHTCPSCGSKRIKYFGSGTQKAEAEIGQMPDVQVLRMDQDSTAAKMAHEEILRRFTEKKANVLLGTQMVAKGHDIPGVTLVGILAADSTLNLPDFRASERGFSLLTQAAGRAGRGDKPGRVILQTYDPENETILLAAKQDYDSFAVRDLEQRRELFYPPFSEVLKITVVDKEEKKTWTLADEVAAFLRTQQEETGQWGRTEIMGPFPSGVAKVRDLYRISIVIKSDRMEAIKDYLSASQYRTVKNIYFDVDPVTAI
ncbi:MAG: primosomal protein N' [Acidaminococcaceae bacterium]|nr:primosomal protein N' [Acidaminococcaceae bacterium]